MRLALPGENGREGTQKQPGAQQGKHCNLGKDLQWVGSPWRCDLCSFNCIDFSFKQTPLWLLCQSKSGIRRTCQEALKGFGNFLFLIIAAFFQTLFSLLSSLLKRTELVLCHTRLPFLSWLGSSSFEVLVFIVSSWLLQFSDILQSTPCFFCLCNQFVSFSPVSVPREEIYFLESQTFLELKGT